MSLVSFMTVMHTELCRRETMELTVLALTKSGSFTQFHSAMVKLKYLYICDFLKDLHLYRR